MECGMLPSKKDQLEAAVLPVLTLPFLVALEPCKHHAFLALLTQPKLGTVSKSSALIRVLIQDSLLY